MRRISAPQFVVVALLSSVGVPLLAPDLLSAQAPRAQSALPLDRLKLPPGFSIDVVARIPGARGMAWGATSERGWTLFVGSLQSGDSLAVARVVSRRAGLATGFGSRTKNAGTFGLP